MVSLFSSRGCAAVLCGALLSVSVSPPLRADVPLLRDSYYEVGPYYQRGGISLGGHTATATGIHIQERNGYFGKILWTSMVGLMMALGASDREYLGSSYGPGYRVDYYRMKSAAELNAEAAARAAAVDASSNNEYQTDLIIFFPAAGQGDTRGFIFESYPGSFNLGPVVLDLGLVLSHTRSPCGPEMNRGVGFCGMDSFGIPLRFSWEIGNVAVLDAQVNLNLLALFEDDRPTTTYDHTLRVGLTLHPWQRLFARSSLHLPDFDMDELGFSLEAGMRF